MKVLYGPVTKTTKKHSYKISVLACVAIIVASVTTIFASSFCANNTDTEIISEYIETPVSYDYPKQQVVKEPFVAKASTEETTIDNEIVNAEENTAAIINEYNVELVATNENHEYTFNTIETAVEEETPAKTIEDCIIVSGDIDPYAYDVLLDELYNNTPLWLVDAYIKDGGTFVLTTQNNLEDIYCSYSGNKIEHLMAFNYTTLTVNGVVSSAITYFNDNEHDIRASVLHELGHYVDSKELYYSKYCDIDTLIATEWSNVGSNNTHYIESNFEYFAEMFHLYFTDADFQNRCPNSYAMVDIAVSDFQLYFM